MKSIKTRHPFIFHSADRVIPIGVIDPRSNRQGIKYYGEFLGIILKIFGFAVRIDTPSRTMYVNINSLQEWKKREKAHYHLPHHLHDIDQIINAIKTAPSQPVTPLISGKSAQFRQKIKQTMGNHISDVQMTTLMQFYHQAIRSDNPKHIFNQLIDSKINQPNGWGADKANNHIKRHLLPLLPGRLIPSQHPISSVLSIAQSPIDSRGNKLVCFYKTGPTGFLGNFAHCPNGVSSWGKRFNCSEAAFQWRKYYLAGINDPIMDHFFNATGEVAFQLRQTLDRKYPNQFAPNWKNGMRDHVMWEVLQAKFRQNPSLKKLLDDTRGAYLLEHNQAKRDDYWSDNSDGSGKNILGKMLMAIRDGMTQPAVNDSRDSQAIIYFAQYANSGSLNYTIF